MNELVQRWRIVYRRGPGAADLAQRAEQEAWERAVLASGLPAIGVETARPRLGFAIPLPVGLTAGAERFDLTLTSRLTARAVREALEPVVPAAHAIVELHDVWTGEPSLVSRVVAADYRVAVRAERASPASDVPPSTAPDERLPPGALAAACASLLAADRIERVRRKADRDVPYDLRPFLVALAAADDGSGGVLRMRLRADQVIGAGRPDEVIAALGAALGVPLDLLEGVRERLWLADELEG